MGDLYNEFRQDKEKKKDTEKYFLTKRQLVEKNQITAEEVHERFARGELFTSETPEERAAREKEKRRIEFAIKNEAKRHAKSKYAGDKDLDQTKVAKLEKQLRELIPTENAEDPDYMQWLIIAAMGFLSRKKRLKLEILNKRKHIVEEFLEKKSKKKKEKDLDKIRACETILGLDENKLLKAEENYLDFLFSKLGMKIDWNDYTEHGTNFGKNWELFTRIDTVEDNSVSGILRRASVVSGNASTTSEAGSSPVGQNAGENETSTGPKGDDIRYRLEVRDIEDVLGDLRKTPYGELFTKLFTEQKNLDNLVLAAKERVKQRRLAAKGNSPPNTTEETSTTVNTTEKTKGLTDSDSDSDSDSDYCAKGKGKGKDRSSMEPKKGSSADSENNAEKSDVIEENNSKSNTGDAVVASKDTNDEKADQTFITIEEVLITKFHYYLRYFAMKPGEPLAATFFKILTDVSAQNYFHTEYITEVLRFRWWSTLGKKDVLQEYSRFLTKIMINNHATQERVIPQLVRLLNFTAQMDKTGQRITVRWDVDNAVKLVEYKRKKALLDAQIAAKKAAKQKKRRRTYESDSESEEPTLPVVHPVDHNYCTFANSKMLKKRCRDIMTKYVARIEAQKKAEKLLAEKKAESERLAHEKLRNILGITAITGDNTDAETSENTEKDTEDDDPHKGIIFLEDMDFQFMRQIFSYHPTFQLEEQEKENKKIPVLSSQNFGGRVHDSSSLPGLKTQLAEESSSDDRSLLTGPRKLPDGLKKYRRIGVGSHSVYANQYCFFLVDVPGAHIPGEDNPLHGPTDSVIDLDKIDDDNTKKDESDNTNKMVSEAKTDISCMSELNEDGTVKEKRPLPPYEISYSRSVDSMPVADDKTREYIEKVLIDLLKQNPSTGDFVYEKLQDNMPNRNAEPLAYKLYTYTLMNLSANIPILTQRLLRMVLLTMAQTDLWITTELEIQGNKAQTEASNKASMKAISGTIPATAAAGSGAGSCKMITTAATPASSSTAEDPEDSVDWHAQRLDVMMLAVLEFFQNYFVTNLNNSRYGVFNMRQRSLMDSQRDQVSVYLLQIFVEIFFDRKCRCKNVQFVFFFLCSLNPKFCERFLTKLLKTFYNVADESHQQRRITGQPFEYPIQQRWEAVSYLGSILVRAKFLGLSYALKTTKYLIEWCFDRVNVIENYICGEFANRIGSSTMNFGNMLSEVSHRKREECVLFHLCVQNILYIMIWKADEFIKSNQTARKMGSNSAGNDDEDENYTNYGSIKGPVLEGLSEEQNKSDSFLHSLFYGLKKCNFAKVLLSKVRPLRRISPDVVQEFQLTMQRIGYDKYLKQIYDNGFKLSEADTFQLEQTWSLFSVKELSVFPFDPYTLRHSKAMVVPLYNEYPESNNKYQEQLLLEEQAKEDAEAGSRKNSIDDVDALLSEDNVNMSDRANSDRANVSDKEHQRGGFEANHSANETCHMDHDERYSKRRRLDSDLNAGTKNNSSTKKSASSSKPSTTESTKKSRKDSENDDQDHDDNMGEDEEELRKTDSKVETETQFSDSDDRFADDHDDPIHVIRASPSFAPHEEPHDNPMDRLLSQMRA